VPQAAHAWASPAPHSPQNFRPGSLAEPHEAQVTTSTRSLYSGAQGRSIVCGYAPAVASETVEAHRELSPDRAWWLRVPAVLFSPRSVFHALREDDPDDVAARGEPILLVIWLAGAAAVLATPKASVLLDKPDYDAVVFAIWAFIAGGIYGAVGYFMLGFSLFFGTRLAGSLGGFRRERQIVGFALVPLALSLLVLLPARLALFGGETFREGGADEGAGETVLLVLQLAFAAWSLTLLAVGVKVVHGWSGLRSLGAIAAGALLLAAIVGVFAMI
jgi:hypothetical protein